MKRMTLCKLRLIFLKNKNSLSLKKRSENLKTQLLQEIDKMNNPILVTEEVLCKKTRDELVTELMNDFIDDITSTISDSDDDNEDGDLENNTSVADADELDEDDDDHVFPAPKTTPSLAFLPCGAHIIQNVIKDGLKLSPEYSA
jgi:hypothetical protein